MEAIERTHEPMTPINITELEETMVFNSRTTSPYSRRRKLRSAASTGSIKNRRSQVSFDHIQEETPSSSSAKEASTGSAKESFENIPNTEKSSFEQLSKAESGLEMNKDAAQYLDEELNLLDEKHKRYRIERDSSGSEIEYVENERVVAEVHK